MAFSDVTYYTLLVLLAVGIVSWFIFDSRRRHRRSDEILIRWAKRHGYRIIRAELKSYLTGSFNPPSTRGQTVYRVVIEDRSGEKRTGWVRCGSGWLGVISDKSEAWWDPE
jgi:hypothetical protein